MSVRLWYLTSAACVCVCVCVCHAVGKAKPGRDVCVLLSHSGQTGECVTAASLLAEKGVAILSVTGTPGEKSNLTLRA